MSNSNGKITSPIGLKEVYDVLGVAKSGTYYDVGYICSNAHGKINMWSKYKPVRGGNANENETNSNWWKGQGNNCGISISRINSIDSVKSSNWTYEAPRIGTDWCRLLDFNKYNHNAEPIIKSRISSSVVEINKFSYGSNGYNITPDTIITQSDDNLSIKDVQDLSKLYFAAAIKGGGTNNAWRQFRGGNVITGYNEGVTIDISPLTNGDYQLALFLSDSKETNSGDYYPMPNDASNKTWVTLRIKFSAPFEFDLTHVGRTLTGTYTAIADINDYFNIPGSGTIYFKGVLRCLEPASRTIPDTDFYGRCEDHNTGSRYDSPMGSCFYDSNRNLMRTINIGGMTAGQTKTIYVKWNGYTGESDEEPENGTIGDGTLDILYKYGNTAQQIAAVGGSEGFEVEW